MATRKIEPNIEDVDKARSKSSGVTERLVQSMTGERKPPTAQQLLEFQKRVNQNLALEKLAEESPDFDD